VIAMTFLRLARHLPSAPKGGLERTP
jgi:hypothetical protein